MFKIKDSLQLISILNFLFKNFQNPTFEVKANKNKLFLLLYLEMPFPRMANIAFTVFHICICFCVEKNIGLNKGKSLFFNS